MLRRDGNVFNEGFLINLQMNTQCSINIIKADNQRNKAFVVYPLETSDNSNCRNKQCYSYESTILKWALMG